MAEAAEKFAEAIGHCSRGLESLRAICHFHHGACLAHLGKRLEATKAYTSAAVYFRRQGISFQAEEVRAHLALAHLWRMLENHHQAVIHASIAWAKASEASTAREALVVASVALLSTGDRLAGLACLRECGDPWADQLAEEMEMRMRLKRKGRLEEEEDGEMDSSVLKARVEQLKVDSEAAWREMMKQN